MSDDVAWRDRVRAWCDPVLAAADVGFEWNESTARPDPEGRMLALLWEADPLRFAARYPDRGIEESYGDDWPAFCLDFWVYLDTPGFLRLSWEGWHHGDELLPRIGDADVDGRAMATRFAQFLRVGPPTTPPPGNGR